MKRSWIGNMDLSCVGSFSTTHSSCLKFYSVFKLLDLKKGSQALSPAQNQLQMDQQKKKVRGFFFLLEVHFGKFKCTSICPQM